tara:strand:- start:1308 stop:1778 length:471 start_codon:yes stop_codon:yes gene_type:complete
MRVEASDTSEDDAIDGFGLAAQRYIESRCRMTVNASSWQKQTRDYIIPLEMGELDTLDAVVSVDDAGAETAITDYRLNSAPSLATLVIGKAVEAAEFRVRWTASAPDDMVESVTQAIAMTAAHFFANRESVVRGTIAAPMPMGVDMLCDSLTLARL